MTGAGDAAARAEMAAARAELAWLRDHPRDYAGAAKAAARAMAAALLALHGSGRWI
jgi:hypothetical protein